MTHIKAIARRARTAPINNVPYTAQRQPFLIRPRKGARLAFIFSGFFIIAIALVAGMSAARQANAAGESTPPDSCFNFDTGSGTITGYYGHEGDNPANPSCPRALTIPSTIDGTAVSSIGAYAFMYNNLSSVVIPSSVTYIGLQAFYGNALTSVDIPDSVTSISSSAFANNNLTDITIPNSVTTIDTHAFSGNQLSSVTVPNSVTTIGDAAFSQNPLVSLTANGNTRTASDPNDDSCFAFNSTEGIITDYVSANIESVRAGGSGCINPAVTIPSAISGVAVTRIGSYAFLGDYITSVTIASSVTSIGNGAFANSLLESVTIPSSVTSIGDSAFQSSHLTSITIPNSVTNIGTGVFSRNQLTSIVLPSSVTTIGASAFAHNLLATATIPSSVTSIGSQAFYDNQLTTITIPNSVIDIGESAFATNALTSATVDGDPTTIDADVLSNNPSISYVSYNGTVYTEANQPSACTYTFDAGTGTVTGLQTSPPPPIDLQLIKSGGSVCFTTATGITNIIIPSTIDGVAVTNIGNYAFLSKGLSSAVIPNSVVAIGTQAFAGNNLTSIIMPNSVLTIGDYAFYKNKLTSITIPSSVTNIGDYAFLDNQLTAATIEGTPTLGVDALWEADGGFTNNFSQCAIDMDPPATVLSDYIPCYNDTLAHTNNSFFAVYTPHTDYFVDTVKFTQETTYSNALGLSPPTLLSGIIVNPAQVTLKFVNQDGQEIQPSQRVVGIRSTNNAALENYSIANSGVATPLNPDNPTPEEAAAINAIFAQYYRTGQTQTIAAPAIAGYTTPSSQVVTLSVGSNNVTFTYQSTANDSSDGDGPLAETGSDIILPVLVAGILIALGANLTRRAFFRRCS